MSTGLSSTPSQRQAHSRASIGAFPMASDGARKRQRELSSSSMRGARQWSCDDHKDVDDSFQSHSSSPNATFRTSHSTGSQDPWSPSRASISLLQSPVSVTGSFRSAELGSDECDSADDPSAPVLPQGDTHVTQSIPKRRKGITEAIVSTALNAALYTGAAALTAYSLWSSWGQTPDVEHQMYSQARDPEPDMGFSISPGKDDVPTSFRTMQRPEEPPPPYLAHDDDRDSLIAGPPARSAKAHRVLLSTQRNNRRPTYSGARSVRQSTPKRSALHAEGTSEHPSSSLSTSAQLDTAADDSSSGEDDEMMRRFEDKMNALIAEGQAALASTPVLSDLELADIDAVPSSPGLPHSASTPRLFLNAYPPTSPFQLTGDLTEATTPASRDRFSDDPILPLEPTKRKHTSSQTAVSALHRARSNMSLMEASKAANGASPFRAEAAVPIVPPSSLSSAPNTPSRLPRASMSGAVLKASNNKDTSTALSSPQSRIPRSSSFLHGRSSIEPRSG